MAGNSNPFSNIWHSSFFHRKVFLASSLSIFAILEQFPGMINKNLQ